MNRIEIRGPADIRLLEEAGFEQLVRARTPYGLLQRSAELWPDRVALRFLRRINDPALDQVLTYAQLIEQVRQAANVFHRLGVGREDTVALLMPNVPVAQVALWAAETAGRACPINPMLTETHLVELIQAAGAKVAVILGRNEELGYWQTIVPALRQMLPDLVILDADADFETEGSDGRLEDLMSQERGDQLDFEWREEARRIAAMFHTGGTTGTPKLAQHTQQNQAFVAYAAAAMYDMREHDLLVNGFPLFHVAGTFVYGLSVLAVGGALLIPTRMGMRNQAFVNSIWQQVERYGITAIGGVPTVISALNSVPLGDADIAILRVMLTGGSPLPPELADVFERNFGTPVRNILGMTECAGVVSIEPFHGPRTPSSTGLALPFTEVTAFRLHDGEADLQAPCAPLETGVIALRGPNVSPGYSDPARNAGTFEGDGWLISGDLGYVDEDGRIFVTGRAKDVIIRGAHNIDPSMIEDALTAHPAVALAAAVGLPDNYAGELPMAFVTLQEGAAVNAEEILDFVRPLIAEPAALPKMIEILRDMPLTPIGKIYKPALRVQANRYAFQTAITAAGLLDGEFELHCNEQGNEILVRGERHLDAAEQALVGIPVPYNIRLTT